jgi:hypothetical protein
MLPRLSYANVAATIALVFSMTGGALAAQRYLITSTKQINPRVLRSLKGRPGPAGNQGPAGKAGTAGKDGTNGRDGANGEPGPLLSELPSGKSERGTYGLSGTVSGSYSPGAATTYPIPLNFKPTINLIAVGAPSTEACPGSAENPTAKAGDLCLYGEREDLGIEYENNTGAHGHFGFFTYSTAAKGDNFEYYGTWAVTAP